MIVYVQFVTIVVEWNEEWVLGVNVDRVELAYSK